MIRPLAAVTIAAVAIAAMVLVALTGPARAQEKPPTPPDLGSSPSTPESVTDSVIKHLDDARRHLDEFPKPETVPGVGLEDFGSAKERERIAHSIGVGMPDLAKPLKVWKTVDCPGGDCRLETESEKAQRKQ